MFSMVLDRIMGTDLTVVNAARASYAKESKAMKPADVKLLNFLYKESNPVAKNHLSCFRHCFLRFKCIAHKESVFWRSMFDDLFANRAGYYATNPMSNWLDLFNAKASEEWYMTISLQSALQIYNHLVTTYGFDYEFENNRIRDPDTFASGLAIIGISIRSAIKTLFPEVAKVFWGEDAVDMPTMPDYYSTFPLEMIVPVLDKGYVKFIDYMEGRDGDNDSTISLEIKAPIMVRQQWFKYVRSGAHSPIEFLHNPLQEDGDGNGDDCPSDDWAYARNEASRRYVTFEPEIYLPKWRTAPENKKQGSGDFVEGALNNNYDSFFTGFSEDCIKYYNIAMKNGIAPEQARVFLPAYALYTSWRLTCTVKALKFFLDQRLENDAQYEIREYAKAVHQIFTKVKGLGDL